MPVSCVGAAAAAAFLLILSAKFFAKTAEPTADTKTHHVQIEIRLDFEIVQHVVQHGAVLAGMDDGNLELLGATVEFVDNYRHLYGFRSGSQYCNGSTLHSTHLWTTAFRHFLSRGGALTWSRSEGA